MLCAIGLILPWLLQIRPGLTPLAACGLVIIMIGATTITAMGGSVAGALFPLIVGLLAASVAYGRRAGRLTRSTVWITELGGALPRGASTRSQASA